MKLRTEKEKEIYWKGFEDGKSNSLKHNIILMKSQLKVERDLKKRKNRKLSAKAENWELHNVQSENRELKSKIHELENKIGYVEGTSSS